MDRNVVGTEAGLDRRRKVELFEQIRREFEFGSESSIKNVAKKFGVHRRMVRQAVANADPPGRKVPERKRPQIDSVSGFIDQILSVDQKAPRKQKHTAHRIWIRIRQEQPENGVAESTVRQYVRERKRALGLLKRETFVPQSYNWGVEAQVDWYEAYADVDGTREKLQVFCMRSMASGGAFHRAYRRATQQSLFEAHEQAFDYFGGIFQKLRYDNMSSAVRRILKGHEREQTERFVTFRSHWKFEAEFCTPGEGHEKGGVEGEAGYFRRNHWVPVPQARDLDHINDQLMEGCHADEQRKIGERPDAVGEGMRIEREYLNAMSGEGFPLGEVSFAIVDGKGCVKNRTNWYSTPSRAGMTVRVNLLPQIIEIWEDGRCVAQHERCYERSRQILNLEHYLDVLERKPGALAGSKPLEQWRRMGRWPENYDRLWQELITRHGKQTGTRQMIELLGLGRQHGYDRLQNAIDAALKLGCKDAAAVRYLITADTLQRAPLPIVEIATLACYDRPMPVMDDYDLLVGMEVQS
jgi:transposase